MNEQPIPAVAIIETCTCHQTYPCLNDMIRYDVFVTGCLSNCKLNLIRLLRSKLDLPLSEINANLNRNPILIGKNLLKEKCDLLCAEFKLAGAQIKINSKSK